MNEQQIGMLKAELKQFRSGDEFYRNPLFGSYVYTEGVKYLAERAGAYWLIDYILSNQLLPTLKLQPFQVWKLNIESDESATIIVEDGNDNILTSFTLEFTDFPLDEMILWLVDKTLLLPSEY